MDSFEKAFQSVLENKINLLTQLKGKISKLDQELETLNSMKEDTELKLRGMERPGRRRKGLVDKWLKDVEQIEKKRRDIMNQINELVTYESTDEVFEEVIKDVENHQLERPSSDRGNILEGVKQTIFGIGGIGGPTTIHQTNSPVTFNIQTMQMIDTYGRAQGNGADGVGKA